MTNENMKVQDKVQINTELNDNQFQLNNENKRKQSKGESRQNQSSSSNSLSSRSRSERSKEKKSVKQLKKNKKRAFSQSDSDSRIYQSQNNRYNKKKEKKSQSPPLLSVKFKNKNNKNNFEDFQSSSDNEVLDRERKQYQKELQNYKRGNWTDSDKSSVSSNSNSRKNLKQTQKQQISQNKQKQQLQKANSSSSFSSSFSSQNKKIQQKQDTQKSTLIRENKFSKIKTGKKSKEELAYQLNMQKELYFKKYNRNFGKQNQKFHDKAIEYRDLSEEEEQKRNEEEQQEELTQYEKLLQKQRITKTMNRQFIKYLENMQKQREKKLKQLQEQEQKLEKKIDDGKVFSSDDEEEEKNQLKQKLENERKLQLQMQQQKEREKEIQQKNINIISRSLRLPSIARDVQFKETEETRKQRKYDEKQIQKMENYLKRIRDSSDESENEEKNQKSENQYNIYKNNSENGNQSGESSAVELEDSGNEDSKQLEVQNAAHIESTLDNQDIQNKPDNQQKQGLKLSNIHEIRRKLMQEKQNQEDEEEYENLKKYSDEKIQLIMADLEKQEQIRQKVLKEREEKEKKELIKKKINNQEKLIELEYNPLSKRNKKPKLTDEEIYQQEMKKLQQKTQNDMKKRKQELAELKKQQIQEQREMFLNINMQAQLRSLKQQNLEETLKEKRQKNAKSDFKSQYERIKAELEIEKLENERIKLASQGDQKNTQAQKKLLDKFQAFKEQQSDKSFSPVSEDEFERNIQEQRRYLRERLRKPGDSIDPFDFRFEKSSSKDKKSKKKEKKNKKLKKNQQSSRSSSPKKYKRKNKHQRDSESERFQSQFNSSEKSIRKKDKKTKKNHKKHKNLKNKKKFSRSRSHSNQKSYSNFNNILDKNSDLEEGELLSEDRQNINYKIKKEYDTDEDRKEKEKEKQLLIKQEDVIKKPKLKIEDGAIKCYSTFSETTISSDSSDESENSQDQQNNQNSQENQQIQNEQSLNTQNQVKNIFPLESQNKKMVRELHVQKQNTEQLQISQGEKLEEDKKIINNQESDKIISNEQQNPVRIRELYLQKVPVQQKKNFLSIRNILRGKPNKSTLDQPIKNLYIQNQQKNNSIQKEKNEQLIQKDPIQAAQTKVSQNFSSKSLSKEKELEIQQIQGNSKNQQRENLINNQSQNFVNNSDDDEEEINLEDSDSLRQNQNFEQKQLINKSQIQQQKQNDMEIENGSFSNIEQQGEKNDNFAEITIIPNNKQSLSNIKNVSHDQQLNVNQVKNQKYIDNEQNYQNSEKSENIIEHTENQAQNKQMIDCDKKQEQKQIHKAQNIQQIEQNHNNTLQKNGQSDEYQKQNSQISGQDMDSNQIQQQQQNIIKINQQPELKQNITNMKKNQVRQLVIIKPDEIQDRKKGKVSNQIVLKNKHKGEEEDIHIQENKEQKQNLSLKKPFQSEIHTTFQSSPNQNTQINQENLIQHSSQKKQSQQNITCKQEVQPVEQEEGQVNQRSSSQIKLEEDSIKKKMKKKKEKKEKKKQRKLKSIEKINFKQVDLLENREGLGDPSKILNLEKEAIEKILLQMEPNKYLQRELTNEEKERQAKLILLKRKQKKEQQIKIEQNYFKHISSSSSSSSSSCSLDSSLIINVEDENVQKNKKKLSFQVKIKEEEEEEKIKKSEDLQDQQQQLLVKQEVKEEFNQQNQEKTEFKNTKKERKKKKKQSYYSSSSSVEWLVSTESEDSANDGDEMDMYDIDHKKRVKEIAKKQRKLQKKKRRQEQEEIKKKQQEERERQVEEVLEINIKEKQDQELIKMEEILYNQLGYKIENNPFGDDNLYEQIKWGQQKWAKNFTDRKENEIKQKLEEIKNYKKKRQIELEMKEKMRIQAIRDKNEQEALQQELKNRNLEAKQNDQRAKLRIFRQELKDVDFFVQLYLVYVDDDVAQLQMKNTDHIAYIQSLNTRQIEDITLDIDVLIASYTEQGRDIQYWEAITYYLRAVYEKRGMTSAIKDKDDRQTIRDIVDNKDLEELEDSILNVEEKVRTSEEAVDIDFWEQVLIETKIKIGVFKIQEFEEIINQKIKQKNIPFLKSQQLKKEEKEDEEDEKQIKILQEEDDELSPRYLQNHDDFQRDGMLLTQYQNHQLNLQDRNQVFKILYKTCINALPESKMDPYIWRVYQHEKEKKLEQFEEIMDGKEEDVIKNPSDSDKKIKPLYLNRIIKGFDWNDYNEAHYDEDEGYLPPPYIKGYRFNIFYPRYVGTTKCPRYVIDQNPNNLDYVIIRFVAEAPYEDVAFRILNKRWDTDWRYGFKCDFYNGILQLHFNFTKHKFEY